MLHFPVDKLSEGDGMVKRADGTEQGGASAKTAKSAATREKIMAAATQLMVERGGTGFQIGEVSDR